MYVDILDRYGLVGLALVGVLSLSAIQYARRSDGAQLRSIVAILGFGMFYPWPVWSWSVLGVAGHQQRSMTRRQTRAVKLGRGFGHDRAVSTAGERTHAGPEGNPGHIDALRELVIGRELAGLQVVHAGTRRGEIAEERSRRVCDGIASSSADVVLVLSMKNLVQDMDAAEVALAGRPVIYWVGDPWGPGKKVKSEMAAWLEGWPHYVFSVGGTPQVQLLQSHGASTVHHTIHTYDHVLFSGSERGRWALPDSRVAFVGSNLSRMPLVSGLPGSMGRWHLVAALKRRYREDFLVAGRGWPRSVSVGPVKFGEQDQFIQRARLLANWDHYADIEAYTSDRLVIAMIAGRPQVTTRHPNMSWLPGPSHGLDPRVDRGCGD